MRTKGTPHLYQIIYRAFHVALLFAILLSGFGKWLGVLQINVWHISIAAILLVGMLAVSYCKIRGKIAGGILVPAVALLINLVTDVEKTGDFWSNYGDWFLGGSHWNTEWVRGYELVQSCIVVAVCYLLQILMERLPWLKDISAILLLGNLFVCMFQKKVFGEEAVSFVLWYCILRFVERTEDFWNKKKNGNHKEYVLRILPFCALYLVLMLALPAPEKPYDWKFVKEAYHNISEKVIIWVQDITRNGQEDFAVARKGFSGEGKLIGGLFDNDRHVLTIQGTQGLRTNVYLTGKIYDTFDGTGWSQQIKENINEQGMDTLETLYAVRRYDEELMENYVFSTGLSVRYEYFDTGCVFVPMKLQRLAGCEYLQNGSNLIFPKQQGYGTEYQLVYFQLNVNHPSFYQMAEAKQSDNEEIWKDVIRIYGSLDNRDITLEDLKAYQKKLIENYQREIVISEAAREYLNQITGEQETDIQKLLAIEEALSGLQYTENPGELPEYVQSEAEFLDYFLFESRKGYCAYFATAFVLLARAEGIPARYVEGFCVPITADKNMTVTSGMAHAWPEVYLEGVGWIPFEPTPGYEELRYTPWKIKTASDRVSSWEPEEMEDLEEENANAQEAAEAALEELQLQKAAKKAEERRLLKLFLLVGAVILAGALLILYVDKLLFRRKYVRMTTEDKFIVEVKRNLWLLSILGFVRRDEETIAELQNRISNSLPPDLTMRFMTFYEERRYGSREITVEILEITKEERQRLFVWLKQTRRWYYYYVVLRFGATKVDR